MTKSLWLPWITASTPNPSVQYAVKPTSVGNDTGRALIVSQTMGVNVLNDSHTSLDEAGIASSINTTAFAEFCAEHGIGETADVQVHRDPGPSPFVNPMAVDDAREALVASISLTAVAQRCAQSMGKYRNYYRIIMCPKREKLVVQLTLDMSEEPMFREYLSAFKQNHKRGLDRNDMRQAMSLEGINTASVLTEDDMPFVTFDVEALPILLELPVERWIGRMNGAVFSKRYDVDIPNIEAIGVIKDFSLPVAAALAPFNLRPAMVGNASIALPTAFDPNRQTFAAEGFYLIPAHVTSLLEFQRIWTSELDTGDKVQAFTSNVADKYRPGGVNLKICCGGMHTNYGYINGSSLDATIWNVISGVHNPFAFEQQKTKLMQEAAQKYVMAGHFPVDTYMPPSKDEVPIVNHSAIPWPGVPAANARKITEFNVSSVNTTERLHDEQNVSYEQKMIVSTRFEEFDAENCYDYLERTEKMRKIEKTGIFIEGENTLDLMSSVGQGSRNDVHEQAMLQYRESQHRAGGGGGGGYEDDDDCVTIDYSIRKKRNDDDSIQEITLPSGVKVLIKRNS